MITYDKGRDTYRNWIVSETNFQVDKLGKCETIMALGNGYMGSRSTFEENYLTQKRNTFVNGTFNKFSDREVSELPNLPDFWEMEIYIDNFRFTLEKGVVEHYERDLNLKDALVERTVVWEVPNGKKVTMEFTRFISMKNLHLLANRIVFHSTQPIEVMIKSGINGQHSNSGSQHLDEEDMRFYEKKYLQLNTRTTQSKIGITLNTCHNVCCDAQSEMFMDRRLIQQIVKFKVEGSASVEKISNIYTEIDKDQEGHDFNSIKDIAHNELRRAADIGFCELLKEHIQAWKENIWDVYTIELKSKEERDQLTIRFAIYHMSIMTPAHDHRMGIGAKGLSGEGYKGHSFWDTEIFILPFFIYTNPKVAKSLLEYRYLGLQGAHKKAESNGYAGAMYPWEAAWPEDGEVTPVWGAVDIVSGEQTKIWSGFIEQHITGDIANAVWQYYVITKDQAFMDAYGYEILFDTAIFWASRLQFNDEHDRYEILDVIGPDEYKEHVDNNAFTNYMAMHNMKLAKKYALELKNQNIDVYDTLNAKLKLDENIHIWDERIKKLYLPEPNEASIIPQDDTYLTKEVIDIEQYKGQDKIASLFKDYNLEQVNDMQISKQADIMILFYLLEDLFSHDVKIANYNYYEPKTTHDSSLSLSTHSILASDLNDLDKAYDLFRRAGDIDLGTNMDSSDAGIHGASLGGIWQCIIMGFGGVRMLNETLRIDPKLPQNWEKLEFPMYWQGNHLHVTIHREKLYIICEEKVSITFSCCGKIYEFEHQIEVAYA